MPLHITKVAYGCESVEYLKERLALRAAHGPSFLTTRYLPKRHEEIVPGDSRAGSLFWIIKHQLIGRTPIVSFGEAPDGRVAIHLEPQLILVQPRPKRAHQGWRYLESADAPADLGDGEFAELPPELAGKLAELGLA